MRIEQFKRQLLKDSRGSGAKWLKVDCHVHMPGSDDYEYRGEDAMQKLGEALTTTNRDIAVILKHQEYPRSDELAALQRFAPKTTLLPGAEINVFVDMMGAKVAKDHFFHAIVVADPNASAGYTFALEKAKQELSYRHGDYPAGFTSSIADVGRFFRGHGCLFIPAHLHQSKPPQNSRSIDDIYEDEAFLRFIDEHTFSALEVRQLTTADFFDGEHYTATGVRIPQAVCVASSDAHHHEHILTRNRATWIRAETPTFSELAAALSFPHRVALREPMPSHAQVVGLHVVGSFIPEVWIALNDGLNALIGSKGSGKTALLECLRFVLNTDVPEPRRESVQQHIDHVLGPAGYVECLARFEDGSLRLITRRADSRERITILDEQDNLTTVDTARELPFPIAILGWHEIEAIADSPRARIEILDRVGERSEIRSSYERISEETAAAREELPILQNNMRRLGSALRELWDLRGKRKALRILKEGDLIRLHDQYEWFLSAEERLGALVGRSEEVQPSLIELTRTGLEFDTAGAPEDVLGGASAALAQLDDSLGTLRQAEEDAARQLTATVAEFQTVVRFALSEVETAFTLFRDTVYQPKVEALDPEVRDVLARRIQILEETKRLPTVERECAKLIDAVDKAAKKLQERCESIIRERKAIADRRELLVGELNGELEDVRLAFLPDSVTATRERFRERHGDDAKRILSSLGSFGSGGVYHVLAGLFQKLQQLTIDESQYLFDDLLWDVKLLDILDVLDEDDVEISLSVGAAGFVPMKRLSAGQRSVAIFPLLLRNAKGPLIIDQPEDNLDNRYIARTIAPDLVKRKVSQQFLVTSHNANLVVLTDADHILHIESDGNSCEIPSSGFLACGSSPVRTAVVDVLDGGAEALAARQHKYGVGST